MRRGTTPTITVTVDADLSALDIYLTFQSGATTITKTGDDLDVSVSDGVTTIVCTLSQEETLSFGNITADVQVRAVGAGGYPAVATDIGALGVDGILLNGVLPDE